MKMKTRSVTYTIGGSRGWGTRDVPPPGSISFIFKQFSAKSQESGKSWIRHCILFLQSTTKLGQGNISVACVRILFTGEYLDRYPPGQVHPPWVGTPSGQVHPLGRYTPWAGTPRQVHPLGRYTDWQGTPPGRYTFPAGYTSGQVHQPPTPPPRQAHPPGQVHPPGAVHAGR